MSRERIPKKEKSIEVLIPKSVFEKIKEKIKGTDFSSVSDYVIYVLKEILSEEEEEETVSEEEEEKIKERLRALGYIE